MKSRPRPRPMPRSRRGRHGPFGSGRRAGVVRPEAAALSAWHGVLPPKPEPVGAGLRPAHLPSGRTKGGSWTRPYNPPLGMGSCFRNRRAARQRWRTAPPPRLRVETSFPPLGMGSFCRNRGRPAAFRPPAPADSYLLRRAGLLVPAVSRGPAGRTWHPAFSARRADPRFPRHPAAAAAPSLRRLKHRATDAGRTSRGRRHWRRRSPSHRRRSGRP